jgi:hypothetical protein
LHKRLLCLAQQPFLPSSYTHAILNFTSSKSVDPYPSFHVVNPLHASTMPGTDIESLPLFMYEEIGSYCDNKTLTQLVSVSVNFYNWFNGSRLKNFCMFGHMHVVTYWLKGLLSERSQRLVPRLKAIE